MSTNMGVSKNPDKTKKANTPRYPASIPSWPLPKVFMWTKKMAKNANALNEVSPLLMWSYPCILYPYNGFIMRHSSTMCSEPTLLKLHLADIAKRRVDSLLQLLKFCFEEIWRAGLSRAARQYFKLPSTNRNFKTQPPRPLGGWDRAKAVGDFLPSALTLATAYFSSGWLLPWCNSDRLLHHYWERLAHYRHFKTRAEVI